MRGIRSFICWHKIPEFETVSSSDDSPFAGACVQPTGKVSVKLPVDDWLCRKMDKLNFTITEGYPARNTDTAGLEDEFIKSPRSSRWYGCMLRRTVRATPYAPGHRNQPNSTISSVGLHVETFLLPHPSGPSARTCSGVGREQHVNRRLCVIRLLVCQGV